MEEAERRRAPRVARSLMIRYQPPGKRTWLMSSLRDLSSGGARFLSEHMFAGGEVVEVRLVLPTVSQPVPLKARVAWTKPWRASLLEVGITFDPGDAGIQRTIDEAISGFLDRKSS